MARYRYKSINNGCAYAFNNRCKILSVAVCSLSPEEKARCDRLIAEYLASATPEALYRRADSERRTAEALEASGAYWLAWKHNARARRLEARAMKKEVRTAKRRAGDIR